MRSSRVELEWISPLVPKTSASANSATTAAVFMIAEVGGLFDYVVADGVDEEAHREEAAEDAFALFTDVHPVDGGGFALLGEEAHAAALQAVVGPGVDDLAIDLCCELVAADAHLYVIERVRTD